VYYLITYKNINYCHITDTGRITKLLQTHINKANYLFIESDYDFYHLDLVEEYTDELKDRIRSPWGHLSNQRSVNTVKRVISNLNWATFGHLSEHSNSPEILQNILKFLLNV
jgi:phosphoribosyl 1,2-cyclic phosphodiesterase